MEQSSFTRIKNDVNGNPRYVCHFLALNTNHEKDNTPNDWNRISNLYAMAVKRANKIGGRKYHTKSYGGGIVFQSYNLQDTINHINAIVAKDEAAK